MPGENGRGGSKQPSKAAIIIADDSQSMMRVEMGVTKGLPNYSSVRVSLAIQLPITASTQEIESAVAATQPLIKATEAKLLEELNRISDEVEGSK
jgi:hypothetical protein